MLDGLAELLAALLAEAVELDRMGRDAHLCRRHWEREDGRGGGGGEHDEEGAELHL